MVFIELANSEAGNAGREAATPQIVRQNLTGINAISKKTLF